MRSDDALSLGQVARHFGCRVWQVRRLYERGLLPPARRIGGYRYVTGADLPQVEAALMRAGYIRAGPAEPGVTGVPESSPQPAAQGALAESLWQGDAPEHGQDRGGL